jgi:phage-related baseplate assembly protein
MTSTLPEPNFISRDVNTITQEWIALYEQKTGKTLQPAQIERILIDVGVYRENLLRIGIQEAAKQNLVNFATYPMLDYLGELVGVYRIAAKASKTTIKFNLAEAQTFNVSIPANTQIESKDGKVIFMTLKDSLIPAGSLSVETEVESETEGIIGNGYLADEIKNLITPLPYIESAENTTVSSGGADIEDDDSLRERIKQAPEKFSNAGSNNYSKQPQHAVLEFMRDRGRLWALTKEVLF